MKPSEPVPSFGKKTKYRGIEFKSQCEARWAALFDILKWSWEYEPNGESTFPDFEVTAGKKKFYLEVKGSLFDDVEIIVEVDESHDDASEEHGEPPVGTSLCPNILGIWLPERWVSHPDAIKARESAKRYKQEVLVGDAQGHHYYIHMRRLNASAPEAWRRTTFPNQSKYDWDRTLVMVTSRGKQ